MLDYYGRLLKTFPSFTEHQVRFELPMDRGWAYYSWSIENDGWLQFAGVTRSGPAYIKQEVQRLMEEVKQQNGQHH